MHSELVGGEVGVACVFVFFSDNREPLQALGFLNKVTKIGRNCHITTIKMQLYPG